MKVLVHRLLLIGFAFFPLIVAAVAQDIAPPIPQKLVVHSNVLNEDRVIWVRAPHGYETGRQRFPVLYITDAPGPINEIGAIVDFLVDNDEMPPVIVVALLTPIAFVT